MPAPQRPVLVADKNGLGASKNGDGRVIDGFLSSYSDRWMPVFWVLAWRCFMMDATRISSISGLASWNCGSVVRPTLQFYII